MVVNVNTKHKTKTSQTCILTLLIFVLFKKEAVLSRLISTQGTLRMFFLDTGSGNAEIFLETQWFGNFSEIILGVSEVPSSALLFSVSEGYAKKIAKPFPIFLA